MPLTHSAKRLNPLSGFFTDYVTALLVIEKDFPNELPPAASPDAGIGAALFIENYPNDDEVGAVYEPGVVSAGLAAPLLIEKLVPNEEVGLVGDDPVGGSIGF